MKTDTHRPRVAPSLALAAAVLIAGCGGGDNSGRGGTSATPAAAPAAGTLQLSWQAPAENTDGSTLDDLAGYRIYYGTASGLYTRSVTVADPSALGYTVGDLPAGTYYAIVRSYNAGGTESDASAEVSKTIR